ncbi:MAG TPA: serine/threonine-protein kinase [Ktedonobacteraceae bacterium]|nr:serine/threonine-protein kinase [Ktedonobacteraceae bacterium]
MIDYQGQQFDNYRIIGPPLGVGSFGKVYLAEHIYRKKQAPVAIKVLSQLPQDDLRSFLAEARTAHLKHPNIVQILDFGVEKHIPFIVMKYAPNGTLRQRHPKGTRVSLHTIVSYVKQIASALQYAHDERLVHRDIKPENLLIGEQNQILLSDFGLATIARSMSSQSVEQMAGTIPYMAPEQIQSHPHPASDQYSLGVVVYEWLCGERPFKGSFTEIAAKHTMVPPPPLHDKMPTITPEVEQIVMKALAKDSKQRFDSVSVFATMLEQACANTVEYVTQSVQPERVAVPAPSLSPQESTIPTIESTRKPTQPRISRRKIMLGLGTGLALVVTAGGLTWLAIPQIQQILSRLSPTPTRVPSSKPTPTPILLGSLLYTYTGHHGFVNALAWSPDGKRIASGSDDSTVQVWNAANGSNVYTYQSHSNLVEAVAWSPDGKRIASGGFDSTVQMWDAADGGHASTYHMHSGYVVTVAWSPDGKRISSGSYDKTVQVWNASNGNLICTYSKHLDAVSTVAWSPDGKRIASGSWDNTVQVWDTADGGHVVTYRGHLNRVNAVVWSPNGKRIASASSDATVQVWNAANGDHVVTYRGHSNAVLALAWSPDGKHIASGSDDNTVQIWNAANGSYVYTYPGHSKEVRAVAWSPDGRRIASGSDDTTVQVWGAG